MINDPLLKGFLARNSTTRLSWMLSKVMPSHGLKISSLLAKGTIVRVKKGLYILGESLRRRPYCRELLANLIYGPSYVSLEYALPYHGLTPEVWRR